MLEALQGGSSEGSLSRQSRMKRCLAESSRRRDRARVCLCLSRCWHPAAAPRAVEFLRACLACGLIRMHIWGGRSLPPQLQLAAISFIARAHRAFPQCKATETLFWRALSLRIALLTLANWLLSSRDGCDALGGIVRWLHGLLGTVDCSIGVLVLEGSQMRRVDGTLVPLAASDGVHRGGWGLWERSEQTGVATSARSSRMESEAQKWVTRK